MEVTEALALLNADRGDDAKQLKRAYLRALKRHRPETDPEGFKRVREAFELVERLANYGVLREYGQYVPPAPIPEPVQDAPGASTCADAALAPECVAENDRPADEVGEWPEFDTTEGSSSLLQVCYSAHGLADEGKLEHCLAAARRVVDGLPAERDPEGPASSLFWLVLKLERQGHAEQAKELFEAVDGFVRSASLELRLHGVKLGLLRELYKLPTALPYGARAALARTIEEGAPDAVERELRAVFRWRLREARQLRKALKRNAPTLNEFVGGAVRPFPRLLVVLALIYCLSVLPLHVMEKSLVGWLMLLGLDALAVVAWFYFYDKRRYRWAGLVLGWSFICLFVVCAIVAAVRWFGGNSAAGLGPILFWGGYFALRAWQNRSGEGRNPW